MTNLLNIGCGGHFHTAWTNVDLVSVSPHVAEYDIRKALPYPDARFDACYSSHVLEHLTHEEAVRLIGEQLRVLKPGGIIRVVVPDLEQKARLYVQTLDAVLAGNTSKEADYDWMVLEIYDQTVRTKVGGEMGAYLHRVDLQNADFIVARLGDEAENWLRTKEQIAKRTLRQKSFIEKLRSKRFSWILRQVRLRLAALAVQVFAGAEARRSFHEGVFRNSGEIHRWMYDRFSLGRLLRTIGFTDITICRADESRIPNFASYELDTIGGKIRKADSLFMEARKP